MSNIASSARQEKGTKGISHRLILYLAFCLAVLLAVTCFTLRSARRISCMGVSGSAEVPIGEITAGTVVCQSVPVDDPLASVSVLFATWGRTNSGTVDVQVVGFMEFPAELQPLIRDNRIVFSPLVDFMELQRLIAQVDVNIVPLVQNTFTNCKSELKFFEASAVDTVTVATPTYTYEQAIVPGETGFLCRQGQWYSTIARLYQGPELSETVAHKAKAYCLEKYAGEAFHQQVCAAYDSFLK